MSTANGKDVIYIDIDDEITGIIDKARSAHSKIVALVLPKRATVFQSIVNMKLLKRSAEEAQKHVVLITSEAGLLPLAAGVGMHVAKNLQSKPEIPVVSKSTVAEEDADDEEAIMLDHHHTSSEPKLDKHRSVGDLAKEGGGASAVEDAIEFDNSLPNSSATAGKTTFGKSAKKSDKSKRLKIPNFDRFRLRMILGATGVVLLIVVWYMAIVVMPSATVMIKTNSTAISTSADLTLNTSASGVNVDEGIIPAQVTQTEKTLTQQTDASGQKNTGDKASGGMTITNCSSNDVTLPAGTGFSAGGYTFISQDSVTVPQSDYRNTGGGFVCRNNGTADVDVVAQSPGAAYNLSSRAYTIANNPTNVKAQGSDMDGGTDVIVKIVSQSDIDTAKDKLGSQNAAATKQELQRALQTKGLYAVAATFNSGTPDISTDVKAGDQADKVTVTEKVTYTMLGVHEPELKKLIADKLKNQIDTRKQTILDYGLGKADFKLQGGDPATAASVTMQVTSVAGPDLHVEQLKKQIAGKKSGDATAILKANPGVTDVDVKYSPFWVSSIPKKASKITVQIEKPTSDSHASS